MADEQVVPSFPSNSLDQVVPSFPSAPAAPAAPAAPPTSRKRKSSSPAPPAKRLAPSAPYATPLLAAANSRDSEIRTKPRWETPRRRGNWPERYPCAAEDSRAKAVPVPQRKAVCANVRGLVAQAVVANVGLPHTTVDKWLHLLAEYLELNADEHVLAICLVRRYLAAGRSLVGENDWARPQRWECVIAISCYLAVLLSEEFPGRTAFDLKELLGANFRFGREQIEFLKAIDWKASIPREEFEAAAEILRGDGNSNKMTAWFTGNLCKEAVEPTTADVPAVKSPYHSKYSKPAVPHVARMPNVVVPVYSAIAQETVPTVPSLFVGY